MGVSIYEILTPKYTAFRILQLLLLKLVVEKSVVTIARRQTDGKIYIVPPAHVCQGLTI